MQPPVYFCRGVADRERGTGYVADAGKIVAARLGDGVLLWRSPRAGRPLICEEERLAAASSHEAQANTFDVVVLGEAGMPVLVSAPVALPDWVDAASCRPETFRISAFAGSGRLRLEWEAHAHYRGGAAPSPEILAASAHDATGAVEVDLGSGAVAPLPSLAREDIARPPLAPDEGAERWRTDTTVARLVWDVGAAEQSLALELHDPSTADAGTLVQLMRGKALVTALTPDGTHVLVHDEGRHGPWHAFSVATARRIAAVTHDAGAHSPAILGDRLFYLVDRARDALVARALRARALASDALLWELPLGERPHPPATRLRQ